MRWLRTISRVVGAFMRAVRARPRTAIPALVGVLLAVTAAGWYVRSLRRDASPKAHPATTTVSGPPSRPARVVTFDQGCTTGGCHAEITKAPAVHAPASHAACNACHAPDTGDHTFPLLRPKASLCSVCHDVGERDLFQHKAMSGESCLACHNPHAGENRALLVAETIGATCARCHPPTEGHTTHRPYADGRCVECHDPHGADNPSLLIGGGGAGLCVRCHAPVVHAVETGQHAHRTLEGSCSACHAPHAATEPGLLHAKPRDMCITCHPDIAAVVTNARVTHDPVLKDHQCVTCHEPHASENARMLRGTQAAVCLSCHDKPVKATDGRAIAALSPSLVTSPVVHGAVTRGDCGACHSVHGGQQAQLLRQINPETLAGPFDVSNYALCFSCHDQNITGAASATSFRDGDRNLHEAHLRSGDSSRGCGACHAVHTSDLPRLIATTVRYEGSDWAMPMKFTVTATGGSCAPGCHEPMSYSRTPGGAGATNSGGPP